MTWTEDNKDRWAEICADFHAIRLEATRLRFRSRWTALVRETLDGKGSLAGWQALVADITAADGVDEDFVGRHGASGKVARDLRSLLGSPADVEYECPKGLCSRRAQSATGGSPRCDLLNAAMSAPSSAR
jgi:hypothetical protein